jgi:hypothetical protein
MRKDTPGCEQEGASSPGEGHFVSEETRRSLRRVVGREIETRNKCKMK